MEPIGQQLREARERRGVTLDAVKRELRIHGPYLEALEAEEFAALPAPAYARAFLRQYAAYLGLDPEPLVAAYNARAGNEVPALNVGWTAAPQAQRSWSDQMGLVLAGLVVGLLLVGAYGIRSYLVGKEETARQIASSKSAPRPKVARKPAPAPRPATAKAPTAATLERPVGAPGANAVGAATGRLAPAGSGAANTPPANAAAPAGSGSAAPVAAPPSGGTTLAPTAPSPGGPGSANAPLAPTTPALEQTSTGPEAANAEPGSVEVTVNARERCWVRVRADGELAYEGALRPGDARSWRGSEAVEVLLGNAGGVSLAVNGQDLGPAGKPGEVVRRVFRGSAPAPGA
jgi:cytoskeleton protein RodZ